MRHQHHPSPCQIPYLAEEELYAAHRFIHNATLALLDLLRQANNKTRLLCAGDVHFFARGRACHQGGECVAQLVTSGMTRTSTRCCLSQERPPPPSQKKQDS